VQSGAYKSICLRSPTSSSIKYQVLGSGGCTPEESSGRGSVAGHQSSRSYSRSALVCGRLALRSQAFTSTLRLPITFVGEIGKFSESVQWAMLKACDACADMGQLQCTVPIRKTFHRIIIGNKVDVLYVRLTELHAAHQKRTKSDSMIHT